MGRAVSFSLVRSPLTAAILDGAMTIGDIDPVAHEAKSVNRNSRQMLAGDFEVGEMSLATYVRAREDGLPLIGIPVFTGRRFVHSGIHCRPGAGIADPGDLRGRRVGLPQFWMTSSVWHRIFLSSEYDIPQTAIQWVVTSRERLESAGYPPGVEIALSEDNSLGALLNSGRLDAIMVPKRGGRMIGDSPYEVPFAEIVDAQKSSLRQTGIFPIMHFIVMSTDLAKEVPTLPADLFAAFLNAKAAALETPKSLADMEQPIYDAPVADSLSLFDGDPWPYGVEANRQTLDCFLDCVVEQGLVGRRMDIEELFDAGAA
jgi:4,5-dihydroxyphthalate decarboxylase